MNQELMKVLNELNEKILLQENEWITKKLQLEQGRLELENQLMILKFKISDEKDDNGKVKYSNEDKRQGRLQEILTPKHPLAVLKKQLEDDDFKLKLVLNEIEFVLNEIEFLKRSFKVQEILSRGN